MPVLAMVLATAAMASNHGHITSIAGDERENNLVAVSIDTVNGRNLGGSNPWPIFVRADAGTAEVLISLNWFNNQAPGVAGRKSHTYSKTVELDVEEGKTYFLAARIDYNAPEAAWADGSFWTPVITEVR